MPALSLIVEAVVYIRDGGEGPFPATGLSRAFAVLPIGPHAA
jgi:hypothetical protein